MLSTISPSQTNAYKVRIPVEVLILAAESEARGETGRDDYATFTVEARNGSHAVEVLAKLIVEAPK